MPIHDIIAFVSNRGGCGKSSLVSQVTPAIALAHPELQVLVIDFSIQADASTMLLGGFQEPKAYTPKVYTRGGENIGAIPQQKTAAALIQPPAQPAAAASMWRGSARGAAAPPFNLNDRAVRVRDVHPEGNCPTNLWLCPSTRELYPFFPADEVRTHASAVRAALDSCTDHLLVVIDTDAEVAERMASKLGVCIAQRLSLVLGPNFPDYLRTLTDQANSLYDLLESLPNQDLFFRARIDFIVINKVNKTSTAPCKILEATFPFTPPARDIKNIEDILSHIHSVAAERPAIGALYFRGPCDSAKAMAKAYAAGVAVMPTGAVEPSINSGTPVVCMTRVDAATAAVAGQIVSLAQQM
jgi:MinD-like ATPase involved in chromosome partitioning or flagellar assembly